MLPRSSLWSSQISSFCFPTMSPSSSFLDLQCHCSLHSPQWKEAFSLLDRDGDGEIDSSDLHSFFSACMGSHLTHQDIASMISLADTDGDGKVDFLEFQRLLLQGGTPHAPPSLPASHCVCDHEYALHEMFRALDENRDGAVCKEDLKAWMRKSRGRMNITCEEDIDLMLEAACQSSNSSKVSYEEFVKLMTC